MVATHCRPNTTLGTNEIPVPNVSAATATIATPAGSKRGVALTFQGLWLTRVDTPPDVTDSSSLLMFATLQSALVADGWVAVTPSKPSTRLAVNENVACVNDLTSDTTGKGARLLASYQHWFDHLIEWCNRTYPGFPVIVTGVSMGGWIAIQMARSQPSVIAYAAEKPLMTWSSLPLVAGSWPADTSGADLGAHSCDNLTAAGFIGWSTSDTTVGSTVQQAMYTNAAGAGRPVTSNATTEGHGLTAADVTAISSWLTASVHSLAPATH